MSEDRRGDEHRTHFRSFQRFSNRLAALRDHLTLQAVLTRIWHGRRVIGITVVVVVPHVIDTRYTCTRSTKVLGSAQISLSVKLWERSV